MSKSVIEKYRHLSNVAYVLRPPYDWEEIYRCWLYSTKSVECIAKELNLDPSTVRSHITIRLRNGKS